MHQTAATVVHAAAQGMYVMQAGVSGVAVVLPWTVDPYRWSAGPAVWFCWPFCFAPICLCGLSQQQQQTHVVVTQSVP